MPPRNPNALASLIAVVAVSGAPIPERAVGDVREVLHERALSEGKAGDQALGDTPHPETLLSGELDRVKAVVDSPSERRDAMAELLEDQSTPPNDRSTLKALLK